MNVSLNIENDKELRDYIKDAIKGQVLSIVRDEFMEIVKHELNRKVKGISADRFDKLFKETLGTVVEKILREQGVSQWRSDYVAPTVEKAVNNSIQGINFNKLINECANAKIKLLINSKP